MTLYSDRPIVIAEIGQSHNGDLKTAFKTIDLCSKHPEISLVKFQLYDSTRIFSGSEPFYLDSVQAELTYSQALAIVEYARDRNVPVFFSVFDLERLGWLKDFKVKIVKFGWRTWFQKDGMKMLKEAKARGMITIGTLPPRGSLTPDFRLYAKTDYPCSYDDRNWAAFEEGLKEGWYHGLSDHSVGVEAVTKAVRMGAFLIEKHVKHPDISPKVDAALSVTPSMLARAVRSVCRERRK